MTPVITNPTNYKVRTPDQSTSGSKLVHHSALLAVPNLQINATIQLPRCGSKKPMNKITTFRVRGVEAAFFLKYIYEQIRTPWPG